MQPLDMISSTSELGSLIAHSNDESEFVGSSSGVFFVNTVRQSFAKSLGLPETSPTPDFPAPEDTIVGPPESPRPKGNASRGVATTEPMRRWTYNSHIAGILGISPTLEDARQLMMTYFKLWHPLFPFLHGPSFLQAMEAFYSKSSTKNKHLDTVSEHRRVCWTIIFQCVFNISSLVHPELHLVQESKVKSAGEVLELVNLLLNRHDILSLQALLAMQLYLVATMSLRNASLLGGSILRSVLHAGLHRCPYRYQQLSSHDRQLRKRIFWCFYAIDRYLSQALGLPLGIQDSDIDVCLPSIPECHIPDSSGYSKPKPPRSENDTAANNDTQPSSRSNTDSISQSSPHEEPSNREATLAGFVTYGKLTGRALELFHKSINRREIRRSTVLYLVSDVHKWWNNLPSSLQGPTEHTHIGSHRKSNHDADPSFDLSPFYSILYKHLILCINRPCLSLEPSSPDFCSGLQICIDAARSILTLLKTQLAKGQAFFWPGLLSAAYMSGLVIAFACQLGQYSLSKGCQEISDCCDILQVMCRQWEIAKNCHTALSILILNIQQQSKNHGMSKTPDYSAKRVHRPDTPEHARSVHSKRRRVNDATVPDQQDRATTTSSSSTTNANTATTYRSLDNDQASKNTSRPPPRPLRDSQGIVVYNSQPTTAADLANDPSSSVLNVFRTHRFPESTPTVYEGIISPSEVSALAIPNNNNNNNINNEFEDLRWPDEPSYLTANFDLNMTDLFQNSSWDPMLFDAFNQD